MKNGIMMQGFEWYMPDDGGYYKFLKEEAKALREAGITAVWMPPSGKATGTNDVGYGAYDLFDLGEFDQKGSQRTKYGTKEELVEAIETLHELGMEVYVDIVLNHKAGGDYKETFKAVKVDSENRLEEIEAPRDIEGWTGFNFPGRGGKYSEFEWHFYHFDGVDYDARSGDNGVFRILGDNKHWDKAVSGEKGNYDYLMFADVDMSHPEVRGEYFHYIDWIIGTLGADGLRYDALKHIDYNFIRDLSAHVRGKWGEDFYIIGEYWKPDGEALNNYVDETNYIVDLFDVILHLNFERISKNSGGTDLRHVFDGTLVQEHPSLAVTFVDNHDSQPGQSLESYVEPWFKESAYALILFRRDGYPCVFWGDYYGTGGEHPMEGMKDMLNNMMHIRTNYAYGDQDEYFHSESLIGWVRRGNEEHPGKLAVLISTGDRATLKMHVGPEEAGKTYLDRSGKQPEEVIIDEEGNGEFTVGPGAVTYWTPKED